MDQLDVKQQIDQSLGRLRTMRDEMRVRAHLGGMELQDALRELEQRLDAASERATQHAAESVLTALHELDKTFTQFATKLAAIAPSGEAKHAAAK